MREHQPMAEATPSFEADREHLDFFRSLKTDGNFILGTLGFGIRISRDVQTFAFDHKTKEVLINPEFIERENLSKEEQRYIFGHEIAHFVQIVQDPDTYLETFEDARKRAEKVEDPELRKPVQKAWNRYYNVFLDVHDNAIVDARSMWTQGLVREDHPRQTLYERFEKDLRGMPKVEQFQFAILKRVMVGSDAEVELDEDVSAVIDAPFRYAGKEYKELPDFIREHFFDSKLPLSVWMSKLKRTLTPIFESLLAKDIESGDIRKLKKVVELTGDESEEDDIKKIIDEIRLARENGTDRARRSAQNRYRGSLEKHDFSEHDINTMQSIRETTEAIYPTLVDLWDAFVTVSSTTDIVKQTGYRSGENFDIDAFVRELPRFLTQPDQARIMERSFNEPVRDVEKPKRLSLVLALDLSGSMGAEKRRAVQEVSYALSRSLIQYQIEKSQQVDPSEGERFRVDLRAIGFGDEFQDIFQRTHEEILNGIDPDIAVDDLEARLARAVLDIGRVNMGGTQDAGPLNEALQDARKEDMRVALVHDDATMVVVEITDGNTGTQSESKKIVKELNNEPNVYARAIQIPGLSHADRPLSPSDIEGGHGAPMQNVDEMSGVFHGVWGDHGKRLDHLEQLKEILIQILFATLLNKQQKSRS
ncbi:MAG: hypothetical protein NUV81_03930 [bacterium]|nr:hypothetical protein [bacterium]